MKEKLGVSDEETVLAITENPYLQYFIGLHSFQEKAPFDASSMTHFRKRFPADFINHLNERIVQNQKESTSSNDSSDDDDGGNKPSSGKKSPEYKKKTTHQGKLMLDATCAPADIAFPSDLKLLNEAREKLEGMMDTLMRLG